MKEIEYETAIRRKIVRLREQRDLARSLNVIYLAQVGHEGRRVRRLEDKLESVIVELTKARRELRREQDTTANLEWRLANTTAKLAMLGAELAGRRQ